MLCYCLGCCGCICLCTMAAGWFTCAMNSCLDASSSQASPCFLPTCHRCRAQAPRTVLLYGPPGSGKRLLAAAVAHQAGATLFDLSPAAIAGKYAGKAAATMVHMVRGMREQGGCVELLDLS